MFLQGLPGSIPWGVYSSYLHDILANEKKFSADSVLFSLSLSSPPGVVAVHLLRDRRGLRERALGPGLPVLLPRQSVVSPARRRDRLSHQHAITLRSLLALSLRGPLRLRVLPPPRAASRRARCAAQHPRTGAQKHPAQRQSPAVQRNRHGHRGGVQ